MLESIKALAEQKQALAQRAYLVYLPLVDSIIDSGSKDTNPISHTLDYLLDFCIEEENLQLYRKLCRYLYSLDPASAAYYANAYREMWDEKGERFGLPK